MSSWSSTPCIQGRNEVFCCLLHSCKGSVEAVPPSGSVTGTEDGKGKGKDSGTGGQLPFNFYHEEGRKVDETCTKECPAKQRQALCRSMGWVDESHTCPKGAILEVILSAPLNN